MSIKLNDLVRGDPVPVFLNIGVRQFGTSLLESGFPVVFVDWTPPAGGDPRLAALLDDLL